MKKQVCRLLCLALLVSCTFSACGAKNADAGDTAAQKETERISSPETEKKADPNAIKEQEEKKNQEEQKVREDQQDQKQNGSDRKSETAAETETEAADTAEAQAERQARIDAFCVQTEDAIYTYDQMERDLLTLQELFPEDLAVETQGVTADGRNLYVCYVGNRQAAQQIVIVGATHAREYMTTQLIMKQLEQALKQKDTGIYGGKTYREYLDQVCFVLMPMLNPDGVTISQMGLAGIRSPELQAKSMEIYQNDVQAGYAAGSLEETLRLWKANAEGVDLNRNFSTGWDLIMEHPLPSSGKYKGTEPGSEPETQAQMQLVDSLSAPLMVISYHSYGSLVYWQYGQPEPAWSMNEQLAEKISGLTGYYLAGYSNEAGFSNWCVVERGIPSVTVETGSVNCPLPASQFPELWASNAEMWWMLASEYAGN